MKITYVCGKSLGSLCGLQWCVMIEEACRQAGKAGYKAINVISSVGTRDYYRRLGFEDGELYQKRPLGR